MSFGQGRITRHLGHWTPLTRRITTLSTPGMASSVVASSSSSIASSSASKKEQPPRVRRIGPQLLADELVAEELIAGAPTVKGGRELTTDRDPWTHNAWDKIPWDREQQEQAQAAIERQKLDAVPAELQEQYNADPAAYWDSFYKNVKDNFFSDRAWLRNEFPELSDAIRADAGPKTIVEIGCGPGNTLFPLYSFNENPQLSLHGYDFSKQAVDLVLVRSVDAPSHFICRPHPNLLPRTSQANPSFNPQHLTSAVWDLASPLGLPPTLTAGSVDIALLIFCFSALQPLEWAQAFSNLSTMLKPGGLILFRDYGRNDMAQLRFKKGRLMDDFGGLYVRGDGTRVYFFERDELLAIFGGLKGGEMASTTTEVKAAEEGEANGSEAKEEEPESNGSEAMPSDATTSNPKPIMAPEAIAMRTMDKRFELLQLGVDRRLLLNRKKMIKMYRVWLQGRWRKPLENEE
ncbi:BZ3500_MvSof-1268-A1-R1_Chr8-1g09841 [Microbotryum saponariae]|uniref:BZ3500_MvSof-1268-A1-R1_Chr8-1g09841 protein n=1 Tax=Microbotryum saponariae TaxID=289078 RepID=A0A2X0KVI0_9BASI|nr:BZ3500_MvSof-1268-A1-R1_Chr8-1g09841 [Microbotryum saponariae]SDA08127.1 BZ3501_MvSof-1269-A2-R1_Chr8-1g09564 [Microbotryum saponariae]